MPEGDAVIDLGKLTRFEQNNNRLLPSGGNAVFYKPVGVTTEIRAGYLVKSPPMARFKTEVGATCSQLFVRCALHVNP